MKQGEARNGKKSKTRPRTSKTRVYTLIPLAALVTAVGSFLVVPDLKHVVFRVASGGMYIDVTKDGRLDVESFLSAISDKSVEKSRAVEWMKRHWATFPIDDPDLVGALEKLCSSAAGAPSTDLEQYRRTLRSCDDQPVTGRLRQLSLDRSPPFQRPALELQISTPEANPPADGVAFTCFDGPLENRRIRLIIEGTTRSIEVTARGAFACEVGQSYPDLQINAAQAVALFDRPTRKKEKAIGIVL